VRTLEKHYTLEQAVRLFFPEGPITVSTLRSAIKKQKLQATMPEGKLLVTEAWLAEWLDRCRVAANLPVCGSSPASADDPERGSSLMARNDAALAAARLILRERDKSLPATSKKSISLQED
jgi:hypothetical protein